jgi:hypothetical protein
MGHTATTYYLATDDGESVARTLTAILLAETKPLTLRQVAWWRKGAPGWTMLETLPPWLLLDRPSDAHAPRIASLAKHLGCVIFCLAIHDGAEMLLVEADGNGQWTATGSGDLSEGPIEDRLDPRAGKDGTTPRFLIVPATDAMRLALAKGKSAIRAISRLCGSGPDPLAPNHDAEGTAIVLAPSRGGGRRVRHVKFGEGVVLDELPGDPPMLRVAFADQERVLLARVLSQVD